MLGDVFIIFLHLEGKYVQKNNLKEQCHKILSSIFCNTRAKPIRATVGMQKQKQKGGRGMWWCGGGGGGGKGVWRGGGRGCLNTFAMICHKAAGNPLEN